MWRNEREERIEKGPSLKTNTTFSVRGFRDRSQTVFFSFVFETKTNISSCVLSRLFNNKFKLFVVIMFFFLSSYNKNQNGNLQRNDEERKEKNMEINMKGKMFYKDANKVSFCLGGVWDFLFSLCDGRTLSFCVRIFFKIHLKKHKLSQEFNNFCDFCLYSF